MKKIKSIIYIIILLVLIAVLGVIAHKRDTAAPTIPVSTMPPPEPTEVFPSYTPGAALVPDGSPFTPAACFEAEREELGLHYFAGTLSDSAELCAAGNYLYIADASSLTCVDVRGGLRGETALVPASRSWCGTLSDGSFWRIAQTDVITMQIYSPDCELLLDYSRLDDDSDLQWALISEDARTALWAYPTRVLVFDLQSGQMNYQLLPSMKMQYPVFGRDGLLYAYYEACGGAASFDVNSGAVNPIPGLEGCRPISRDYAVSAADFEGTAAVRSLYSPYEATYLPGENSGSNYFVEDSGLLFRLDNQSKFNYAVRRVYDLSDGSMLQWSPDSCGEPRSALLSASFGWGAYTCGETLYVFPTTRVIQPVNPDYDFYLDSLPDSYARELAAEVYRASGIRLRFGEAGAGFVSEAFSGYAASEEACLPSVEVVSRFLLSLPEGMVQELLCGVADSFDVYLCAGLHTEPNLGWSVGGFTDILDGRMSIVLNIDDYYWMTGNIAHEFWHAAEYRMRLLEAATGEPYISGWFDLMPAEITSLYWNNGSGQIDNQWMNSGAHCGDSFNAPEDVWFVRSYSRSDPGEDRATVFEAYSWDSEMPLLKTCEHLAAKGEYLNNLLRLCYPSCRNIPEFPWEAAVNNLE